MTRRHIDISADAVARAIKGVKKAGIEIKSIRVEPSGAVVINGDNGDITEKELEESAQGYL